MKTNPEKSKIMLIKAKENYNRLVRFLQADTETYFELALIIILFHAER